MQWTKEQEQVIRLRDRSLLVSAAAGSGKTAVLVERIMSLVTDPRHPVDIDRLLIMTFTRAAAGEMRERLTRALEQQVYKNPDNDHLLRQMNLIHTAQITTIHGFCAWLLKNYFHMIGLDPGFRVADEGELTLLREEVMDQLLEACYQEADPGFLNFAEAFATGKDDAPLGGLIQKVYDTAMSMPFPDRWLKESLAAYEGSAEEDLWNAGALPLLWEIVSESLLGMQSMGERAVQLCMSSGGPYEYEDALRSDLLMIRRLTEMSGKKDYDGIVRFFQDYSHQALSRRKMLDVDEGIKKQVKDLRDEIKAQLSGLKKKYFQVDAAGIRSLTAEAGPLARWLVKLAGQFEERFTAAKRDKNILDFTDMEHLALRILAAPDGSRSSAAAELSERFEEVMIDEYQDSNLVQETLAQAVSGWVKGKENLFMVGDVKQSIYRFRQARPELFMEKYASYSLDDSPRQRIDLHSNFRSRRQVLDSVNYVFRQLMGQDLGGIDYDDAAALTCGAGYPGQEEKTGSLYDTEVLLLDGKEAAGISADCALDDREKRQDIPDTSGREEEDDTAAAGTRQLEAMAVADRISRMVGTFPVYDRKTGRTRSAGYGDIVILLRTAAGWADVFSETLTGRGIPCFCASRTGYFSAPEIVTALNLLRVCDNPLQDIPLAGVLLSPAAGFEREELARIRIAAPEGRLFDSIQTCLAEEKIPEDPALIRRLRGFMDQLADFRERAVYTPIHQLLTQILEKTGYLQYARALPGGAQREANLQMLIYRAKEYEKTSYRGLFSFIRYVEHLNKYEVDFGEASAGAEGENSVRIMTVHKSKGLEFPIVFVCGLGKKINLQDLNQPVLLHPDLGIAFDVTDPERRIRKPLLQRSLLRERLRAESLGEELRVLYVAMTRAKEKLILTGTLRDPEKTMEELDGIRDWKQTLLPVWKRRSCRSMLDFLLLALARHPSLYEGYGGSGRTAGAPVPETDCFTVSFIHPLTAVLSEVSEQTERERQRRELLSAADRIPTEPFAEDMGSPAYREIDSRFSYVYPWEYLSGLPVKVSVSELKKRSMHPDPEEPPVQDRCFEPDIIPLIPSFIAGETSPPGLSGSGETADPQALTRDRIHAEERSMLTGADRGTAYHRLMECLDYASLPYCEPQMWTDAIRRETMEAVSSQIVLLTEQKKMSGAEAAVIDPGDVAAFLSSPLGGRMHRAALARSLVREQPFVFSRPARELDPAWPYDDPVLVQGIIDAYFPEGEDIILVDYKTDRVPEGDGQILADRYRVQLEDYAAALTRLTGRKVSEKWIYSFTLGREIRCDGRSRMSPD